MHFLYALHSLPFLFHVVRLIRLILAVISRRCEVKFLEALGKIVALPPSGNMQPVCSLEDMPLATLPLATLPLATWLVASAPCATGTCNVVFSYFCCALTWLLINAILYFVYRININIIIIVILIVIVIFCLLLPHLADRRACIDAATCNSVALGCLPMPGVRSPLVFFIAFDYYYYKQIWFESECTFECQPRQYYSFHSLGVECCYK